MSWKRKVHGGALGFIGFMLSPLSWWNDLFVNVPLALAFAWIVSLIYKPAFEVAWIAGYWLTNLLGFVLMHKGAATMLAREAPKRYSRRDLAKDLGVSLLYTLLIIVLIKCKLIGPSSENTKEQTPNAVGKSEARIPNSEGSPNSEARNSSFELRNSCFGFSPLHGVSYLDRKHSLPLCAVVRPRAR
ncbi:MAG: hypothetical protein L0Y58_06270 [Verrucomicrobia subdivision 3 bacterium]|nr:hypothetical protein [Limisphaerales bacterium]